MAANKFATMLHKNTHRISVILIYAVLEWILILLLLLNSLFSYLISKFAAYFGLKPPCVWCSRVDKFLEPSKTETSYTDLICEFHASEVSKLGYCSNHKKLAKAHDMCEDCSPSDPNSNGNNQAKPDRNFDFFSWVEEMGKISNDKTKNEKIENGEKSSRCSCCDVSLNTKIYTPYWLFKPSWEVLDYVKKGNLVLESNNDNNKNGVQFSDHCDNVSEIRDSNEDLEDEEDEEDEDDTIVPDIDEGVQVKDEAIIPDVDEGVQVKDEEDKIVPREQEIGDRDDIVFAVTTDEKEEPFEEEDPKLPVKGRNSFRSSKGIMTQLYSGDDVSLEMLPAHLEKWYDHDDHFLVTIESIGDRKVKKSENDGEAKSELQIQRQVESNADTSIVLEFESKEGKFTEIKSKNKEDGDDSSAMLTEESCSESDHVTLAETIQIMPCNGDIVEATEEKGEHSNEPQDEKTKSENFIEMEISVQELIDQPQVQDLISSLQCARDDSLMNNNEARKFTDYGTLMTANHQGAMEAEEVIIEESSTSPETIKHRMNHHHHSSIHQDLEKAEKERVLEMPNMEGPADPNKKFLSFEKKELGTEEFRYPSVIEDDIEGGDGILTIEHLKSALAADRNVLNALYAELAAERSAAAIAANQTMVTIAKLQEEKTSMQMEALQCQRMMEEQSEYDQEALKLLNELMVKREKEKQELEKELEIYRKKVYHYEEKEKRRLSRKSSIGRSTTTSSGSCNSEDGDSFNDRQESKQDTPMDTVQNLEENGVESSRHLSPLDESLVDFEVERLAILEQLKVLEEKLFTLDDEDEVEFFKDIRAIESFSGDTSKGINDNYEFTNGITNTNGFCKSEDGEEGQEKRNISENGKRLLPLFDTITMENENEEQGSVSLVQENYSISRCTSYSKKLAIEEEVDHVYQRLLALEADREFLKHCVISLKKGDKGMDLLEEILQHLRELKSVDLRARNMSDAASP